MEMHQFDDTISTRFFVRVTFCSVLGEKLDLAKLRQEFEAIAKSEDMEWQIHDVRRPTRVLVMVSTLDHCFEDLLYRHRNGELRMEIVAVVSNHVTLQPTASRHNIPFFHLPINQENKLAQEQRLLELIESTGTELVVLARYMQILTDGLCRTLRGRAINIHHSFLPGFKGAKPYHQAYDRGVKVIGATAHYVTSDLDEGPIIEQFVERVDHTFTPEMLVSAGRDSERRALSMAVRLAVEHRIFLNGDRTVVFR
jgi:formyltetrahydrofolate deformylase